LRLARHSGARNPVSTGSIAIVLKDASASKQSRNGRLEEVLRQSQSFLSATKPCARKSARSTR